MAIFIHFYILLGFLDLVGNIVLILFMVYFNFKIYKDFLYKTGCLIWDVFFSLSLGTQVFILIRLYLFLFNLSYDNLDYSLSATSSSNVMNISHILTTEPGSVGSTSTGGQNPPPTGNTGDGVSSQNPTMANIKAKILLQSSESPSCRSIYYTGYTTAATLSSGERNLLANTIADDSSDTRPYGVINRTIQNNLVTRVVYQNRGGFESHCKDVLCNRPFREFLERYP